MELENIVANTVYLKAREGKMVYIWQLRDEFVMWLRSDNVLPVILWTRCVDKSPILLLF